MPPSQNLATARRYLASLSAGVGPDGLGTFFTSDARQEELPNRLVPNGATRDLEALKEARARGQVLLSAERFEVVTAVATGDQVAMEVIWTGTIREAAGPFAAGQTLRAQLAIFLTFRDGRIMRQRNYDCYDPW